MKIEIPRPLAAEVLRLAEEADRIEGYTNERPKDQLTRIVDALRPRIVDAKDEEELEMREMDSYAVDIEWGGTIAQLQSACPEWRKHAAECGYDNADPDGEHELVSAKPQHQEPVGDEPIPF